VLFMAANNNIDSMQIIKKRKKQAYHYVTEISWLKQ